MAAERSNPADDRTEWEGYSDYGAISRSVAKSVSNAIENYAWLDAIHRDNGNPAADQVAMARSAILTAAIKLFVEMREECESGNDDYDEILERWTGEGVDGSVPEFSDHWDGTGSPPGENGGQLATARENSSEGGYLRAFQTIPLDESVPPWALQFVTDIRTAGWKLGYLQAGRRSKRDPEDPVQAEAEHMLRGG